MGISLDKLTIILNEYDFVSGYKNRSDCYTHGIHPYTAKLIPSIPNYLISKYTNKNDTILDPFCGSGTALLEARLLQRNAIGIDINPLAKLITEVKTTPIERDKIDRGIRLVKQQLADCPNITDVDFPNKDYWFCNYAQRELSKIKYGIERLYKHIDDEVYRFLQVCFSSIIRKSSYADPRIAKIYKSKIMIEKYLNGWIPRPMQYFEVVMDRNSMMITELMKKTGKCNNNVVVIQGNAKEISYITKQNRIKKVDLIITSPPYINAQDYFRSYKLELWWLGLATPEQVRELRRQSIGTEHYYGDYYNSKLRGDIGLLKKVCCDISRVNNVKSAIICKYFEDMKLVLQKSNVLLKKGGYFCLITGNNTICETYIPTNEIIARIAELIGLKVVEIGRDRIKDRSLPPGRNHKGGLIREEWVTVLQKVRE